MTPPQHPLLTVAHNDACFRLAGEFTGAEALSTSQQIRQFALTSAGVVIDLDLDAVIFMDSVGLRELLALKHAVPTMRIVANERLHRIMAITGTTDLVLGPNAQAAPTA